MLDPKQCLNRYYEQHYGDVVHSGLSGTLQRLFHSSIENRFTKDDDFGSVLELGATSGEHLHFVRHKFQRWTMLDIRDSDKARELAEVRSREVGADVVFQVGDAQDLSDFSDNSIDRLVSMCLLHHLNDPAASLRNWRRVVRPGGQISIFLPCDPGLLWRLGRKFSTFRSAKKKGFSDLEVRFINACDHRNHVGSLKWMIEGLFESDEISIDSWPFRGASWNANLFMNIQVVKTTGSELRPNP